MGLSISRIVWSRDDLLEISRSKVYTAKWEVLQLLSKIPKGSHYIVTYTLDNKGPFLVVKKRIMIVINIKTKEDMGVCFLPRTWDGKRVRRAVITPVYETE